MMYSKAILSDYLYIPVKELRTGLQTAIRKLVVTSKFGGPPIPLWSSERPGYLGVPRHYFRNVESVAETIVDEMSYGQESRLKFTSALWEDQKVAIEKFNRYLKGGARGFVLEAPPASGKCHPAGTEVLMYDGSFKRVEDVREGDLLMGPDSRPRKVLSLGRGFGRIYKVIPVKGDVWECNEDHVLSVCMSPDGKSRHNHEFLNISVRDYLCQSNTFKHHAKLWRTGVDFPEREVEIDPYLVGLYLADGRRRHNSMLTLGSSKEACVRYVRETWPWIGQDFFRKGAFYLHLNNFYNIRRRLIDDSGRRRIPREYLINSVSVRAKVLAGILDGDGHLGTGYYDLMVKDESFADQVLFLARSLGLAAYKRECCKRISSYDFSGVYYRISISGDLTTIPTLRHKPGLRRQKKNPLVAGFSVQYDRDDWYYGFNLSGDGLYLLKDFTVTHNTVMLIKMMEIIGRTALVVVPRSNLVDQWIDRLTEHSNLKRENIGVIAEGKGSWRGKDVVVGLVHSVVLDRYGDGFRDYFGTVVFDEVDRSVPPETFAPAVAMFPAAYRIGASATVERTDGLHVVIQKHIEQVRIRCRGKNRMQPMVILHTFPESSGYVHMGSKKMNRRGMLISRLASNPKRNIVICQYVKRLYASGRRTLVLSDRKQQLVDLKAILVKRFGIPEKEIGFYVRSIPVGGREVAMTDAQREAVASACNIILATYQMFGLGTDIPDLAGLVYATPQADVRQTKGRIERVAEGKKRPIVVDIIDTYYGDAVGWANARRRRYRMEGLVVKRSKWR